MTVNFGVKIKVLKNKPSIYKIQMLPWITSLVLLTTKPSKLKVEQNIDTRLTWLFYDFSWEKEIFIVRYLILFFNDDQMRRLGFQICLMSGLSFLSEPLDGNLSSCFNTFSANYEYTCNNHWNLPYIAKN